MNRTVFITLLMALIMVLIAEPVVFAESLVQKIQFNFEGYLSYPVSPFQEEPSIEASASLSGLLREISGMSYFSTLTGRITVGDEESIIITKPLKTSEPMNCFFEYEYDIDGEIYISKDCMMPMEITIGGDKFTGIIGWNKTYYEPVGEIEYYYFNFVGVKGGKVITCNMYHAPMPPPYIPVSPSTVIEEPDEPLPPPLGLEGASVQKVMYSFEGEIFSLGPIMPSPMPGIEASAVLSGIIRGKDGMKYLSPLSGLITVGGEENNILAKPVKPSEPMNHIEYEYFDIDGYKVSSEEWMMPVKVAIGGDKFMGFIGRNKSYHELLGEIEFFYFNFIGVKDGKVISCSMFDPPDPVFPPPPPPPPLPPIE